jgi:hypothetical protein
VDGKCTDDGIPGDSPTCKCSNPCYKTAANGTCSAYSPNACVHGSCSPSGCVCDTCWSLDPSTHTCTVPLNCGALYGVVRDAGAGSCALLSVDVSTGINKTVGPTTVCDGAQGGLSPSFSALDSFTDPSRPRLLVAIQTVSSLYAVDLSTAEASVVVPMPPYNESDTLLGLSAVGGSLYIVTRSHVYSAPVSGGALTDLGVPAAFPLAAQVTVSPSGGKSGAPLLLIADEGSRKMWLVDVGNPTASPVPSVQTGVNGPVAAHFSNSTTPGGALIEVAAYSIFTTAPATGKSSRIGGVPAGPGYIIASGLSPDGGTLFVADFANLYTFIAAKGSLVGPARAYTAGPLAVGNPQWVV